MSFGQPAWLLAGAILVGLLVALLRRSDARRATDLARFVAARLVPELTTSLSPQRSPWPCPSRRSTFPG